MSFVIGNISSFFMRPSSSSCASSPKIMSFMKSPLQILRSCSSDSSLTIQLSARTFHKNTRLLKCSSNFNGSTRTNIGGGVNTVNTRPSINNLNRSLSTSSLKRVTTVSRMKDWEHNLDPVQKKLLEEECIVLDNKDKVIGHDSKKNCHLVRDNGDVLLHRAFSVFLFNSKGELLLQQRSKTKITFPEMWTNTCCSHPLFTPSEMEEEGEIGIKVAAKRRLEFELGISPEDIRLEDFHYLTRIHYKALSDSIWGEHEIDYILFVQKDLPIKPNKDEVAEIKYVTLEGIKRMENEGNNVQLTPWFKLIYKTWLPLWWKNLGNLKPYDDHDKIHRM